MRDLIAAKRHALALFELASSEGKAREIGNELFGLRDAISKDPVWIEIADDMRVGLKSKRSMTEKLSAALGLHEYCRNLLGLLAEKRYMHLIFDIARFYADELYLSEGRVKATVTLTDERIWRELQDEIGSAVTAVSGKRPVFDIKIDKDIIGGIVIRIGDMVYDGSLRGELKRFNDRLQEKVGQLS